MLVAVSIPLTPVRAQGLPSGIIGWYNGDWKQAIPAMSNWHTSDTQFRAHVRRLCRAGGRVDGDRGIRQVHLRSADVQQAFWEIRTGVSKGNGGAVVASGLKSATLTRGPTCRGWNRRLQARGDRDLGAVPPGSVLAVRGARHERHDFLPQRHDGRWGDRGTEGHEWRGYQSRTPGVLRPDASPERGDERGFLLRRGRLGRWIHAGDGMAVQLQSPLRVRCWRCIPVRSRG